MMRAIYGDPDNPKATPGIVHEIRALESELGRTNELLNGIRDGIQRLMWIMIASWVGAVATFFLKR